MKLVEPYVFVKVVKSFNKDMNESGLFEQGKKKLSLVTASTGYTDKHNGKNFIIPTARLILKGERLIASDKDFIAEHHA